MHKRFNVMRFAAAILQAQLMSIKLRSELNGLAAIAGRLQPLSRVEPRRVAPRARIFLPGQFFPMTPVPDGDAGVLRAGVVGAAASERVVLHVLVDVYAQRSVVCDTGRSGW